MSRPLVYVAHPVVSYGRPEEARALERLAELLPGVELVNPAVMFSTSPAWLRRWPALLADLDGLVVVRAKDGSIGAGCLRELGDAWAAQLPVAMLHRRHLHEVGTVRMNRAPFISPTRLGVIEAGPRYPTGLFASLVADRAEEDGLRLVKGGSTP
jgi:hypothetical protein